MWCRKISEDDERAVYEFGCSDNGIGMSEEFAGHAFEMFSQENNDKSGHSMKVPG